MSQLTAPQRVKPAIAPTEIIYPQSSAVPRFAGIDGLRGFLMCLMALDHAWWFLGNARLTDELWGGPWHHPTLSAAFLSRLASHLCAPGFFLLLGASTVFLSDKRSRAGWTAAQIARFLIIRGAVLTSTQFLLENPMWSMGWHSAYSDNALYFGVMFSLGFALAMTPLWLALPKRWVAAIGVLGLTACQWLVPDSSTYGEPQSYLARALLLAGTTGKMQVLFPVFPWTFIGALGVAFGRRFLAQPNKMRLNARWVGLGLLVAFTVVRFATPWGNLRSMPEGAGLSDYLFLVKYPAGTLYLLATLGTILTLLSFWPERPRKPLSFFSTIGQAPFFFYLGHLFVLGTGSYLFGAPGHPAWVVFAGWAAAIALLFPATAAFGRFKRGRPPESLFRLF